MTSLTIGKKNLLEEVVTCINLEQYLNFFAHITTTINSLGHTSEYVNNLDPLITSLLGRIKQFTLIFTLIHDALTPIPKGIPSDRLMMHPNVMKRVSARNKLKFTHFINDATQLDLLVSELRELIDRHLKPNVANNENIDDTDRQLLTTTSFKMSHFEYHSQTGSAMSPLVIKTKAGHGGTVNVYNTLINPSKNKVPGEIQELESGIGQFDVIRELLF
jgi:hypothetical protein